ncbi:MAG: hypothetical protein IJ145_02550 [Prevotella sp.]|nr:hypothetical protein [Prevotella sp.]
MKTNKKALMGMLVAMVMSLGVMGGIQKQAQKSNELSTQQISAGCAFNATLSEGINGAGWTACGILAGGLATVTGGVTAAAWFL